MIEIIENSNLKMCIIALFVEFHSNINRISRSFYSMQICGGFQQSKYPNTLPSNGVESSQFMIMVQACKSTHESLLILLQAREKSALFHHLFVCLFV